VLQTTFLIVDEAVSETDLVVEADKFFAANESGKHLSKFLIPWPFAVIHQQHCPTKLFLVATYATFEATKSLLSLHFRKIYMV